MWCCICMGKTIRVSFFKKPTRFYNVTSFFKKMEQECRHYWNVSSQNDGFFNTYVARAGTHKTLLSVNDNTFFFAFIKGQNEARNARGRGVGALLLLLLLLLLLWLLLLLVLRIGTMGWMVCVVGATMTKQVQHFTRDFVLQSLSVSRAGMSLCVVFWVFQNANFYVV